MKISEKTRVAIGWALIAYVALHIALNLNSAEIFFLFAWIKMPVAFIILVSAVMGAGALYAFQFLHDKRKKPDGKDI